MLTDVINFSDEKSDLEVAIIWRNNQVMIAIDRKVCWDKISSCPILVRLPKTEKELKELEDKIKWLKTEDGLIASMKYDFDKWMTKYSD